MLCVQRIVVEEPVFLHLRSPMYILGDIHGNFADIYFYMSRLIPFGNMQYCAAQFLFLGTPWACILRCSSACMLLDCLRATNAAEAAWYWLKPPACFCTST